LLIFFAARFSGLVYAGDASHDDAALAVNSQLMRTQDQLDVHIGCISPFARRAISSVAPKLSDSGWTRASSGTHGPKIWARRIEQKTIEGANLFRLAAEGIPDSAGKLGQFVNSRRGQ
jgi:CDP-diacylglycerol pyrophosphatase